MVEFLSVLNQQLNYVGKLFQEQAKNPETFCSSLEQPLLEHEPSALDVYLHGINSLLWGILKITAPETPDEACAVHLDPLSSRPFNEQLVELY